MSRHCVKRRAKLGRPAQLGEDPIAGLGLYAKGTTGPAWEYQTLGDPFSRCITTWDRALVNPDKLPVEPSCCDRSVMAPIRALAMWVPKAVVAGCSKLICSNFCSNH